MRDSLFASLFVLISQSLVGCASAPAPAPVAAPVAPPKAAAPAPAEVKSEPVAEAPEVVEPPPSAELVAVPRQCEPGAVPVAASNAVGKDSNAPAHCFPAADFVEGLCAANYPGVALVMFHPESPWKRGYLKGETKAWTSAPGAQQEERLKFKEEVLVLQSNNGEGGSLAGQGDSFFALRWNGSCVKLTEEEITTVAPWAKVAAPVQWSWLDDNVQEALLADAKVSSAQSTWKKECRKSGNNSPSCERATLQLTDVVVASVRSGALLPEPTSRPKLVRAAKH